MRDHDDEPEKPAFTTRLFYAALAACFGALLGFVCFWLYGLRMSRALPISAVETGNAAALWHWIIGMAAGFAATGFVLCERAADYVGMLFSAILDIERLRLPQGFSGFWWTLLALAVWVMLIWATAPR